MTLTEKFAHPDEPWFNLADEPWLPVRTRDGFETWGLAETLRRAHDVEELAAGSALEQHCLLRFLLACTYFAHTADPDGDWEQAASGGPLPEAGVEAVLDRLSEHLWLLHPHTPFMQSHTASTHLAVANAETKPVDQLTSPPEALVPHIPSNTNEVWWYRDEHLTSPAALARGLLTRHFAGSPGNESFVQTTPSEKHRRSEGGQLLPGPRDTTYVLWKGLRLSSTLVSNLLAEIVDDLEDRGADDVRFFWEDPPAAVRRSDDPLVRLTASGGLSLLAYAGEQPRVLRVPVTAPKANVKALMELARMRDPHALRTPKKDGDRPQELKGLASIVLDPGATHTQNVFSFYSRVRAVQHLEPCVANTALLAHRPPEDARLQALTLLTGGTATGVRMESATAWLLPDASVYQLSEEAADHVREVLGKLDASKGSLASQVTYALRQVIIHNAGGPVAESRAKGLREEVRRELWNRLDRDAEVTVSAAARGQTVDGLDGDLRRAWHTAAADTFEQIAAPYAASPRARGTVAAHRAKLRRKLWTLL